MTSVSPAIRVRAAARMSPAEPPARTSPSDPAPAGSRRLRRLERRRHGREQLLLLLLLLVLLAATVALLAQQWLAKAPSAPRLTGTSGVPTSLPICAASTA